MQTFSPNGTFALSSRPSYDTDSFQYHSCDSGYPKGYATVVHTSRIGQKFFLRRPDPARLLAVRLCVTSEQHGEATDGNVMCFAPSVLTASTINVTIRIRSAWVSTFCSARVGTGGKSVTFIDAWADGVSLGGKGTDEFGTGAVKRERAWRFWISIMGTGEAFAGVGHAKAAIGVLVVARLKARTVGDAEQFMFRTQA